MRFRFTAEMDDFLKENVEALSYSDLTALFGERFGISVTRNTVTKHCQEKWGIHKTDRRGAGHRYTAQQDDWIMEHAGEMTCKELTELFNITFGENVTVGGITQRSAKLGTRKLERHCYTVEELQWLKDHLHEMSWDDLHREFCERFNVRVAKKTLNAVLYKRGILKVPRHHWTEEERRFLIENNDSCTLPELTERFNQEFGLNLGYGAVTQQCQFYLGLRRGENTFQAAEVPAGTERIKNGGKYGFVKVKMPGAVRGHHREAWRKKADVIWEDLHGPLPEGGVVVHLDGNHMNFDPDNLYCINRKIQAVMSSNQWWTDSKEHTLTAIKWCELYYAMKEDPQA